MDDLIRRSDAIKAMAKAIGHIVYDAEAVSQHVMNSIPAVEPKHGEWIWHEDEDICNCSECEFEIDATGCIEPMEYVGVFHYCPNCGARMIAKDINVPNKLPMSAKHEAE